MCDAEEKRARRIFVEIDKSGRRLAHHIRGAVRKKAGCRTQPAFLVQVSAKTLDRQFPASEACREVEATGASAAVLTLFRVGSARCHKSRASDEAFGN